MKASTSINALTGTLRLTAMDHYTAIQWLVHWPLMGGLLHLVQWGGAWAGCGPAQSPPHCTKYNSPPAISGQCTNFILFDVALELPLPIKSSTFIAAVISYLLAWLVVMWLYLSCQSSRRRCVSQLTWRNICVALLEWFIHDSYVFIIVVCIWPTVSTQCFCPIYTPFTLLDWSEM